MRRKLTVLLCTIATQVGAGQPVLTKVSMPDAHVYRKPDPSSDRITTLRPGFSVTVLAAEDEWAIIEVRRERGFIPMESLDRSDPAIAQGLLSLQVEWELANVQNLTETPPPAEPATAQDESVPSVALDRREDLAPSPEAPQELVSQPTEPQVESVQVSEKVTSELQAVEPKDAAPQPAVVLTPETDAAQPRLLDSAGVNRGPRKKGSPISNHPLTPSLIADAIAVGNKSKGRMTGLALKDSASGFAQALAGYDGSVSTGFSCELFSPYSWIAQQASWAAKKYKTFTVEHVDDQMAAPLFRVYAHPDKPTAVTARGMVGTSGVEHIVVRSTADREFQVAQPVKIEPDVEYAQNAFGAKVDMTSQYAEFNVDEVIAISDLDPAGEFFVVIIGDTGEEKKFKVKKKHFSQLP